MKKSQERLRRLSDKLGRWLLFAACLCLLLWMIWRADPQVLWTHILQMGWQTLGLCVAVWGVAYALNTLSWSTIVTAICGHRISYLSMLRYTVGGFALNYITPMGLLGGEPYRIWALKPRIGIEKATSSVLLYSMMHFCSHFMLWIISCIVAWLFIASPSVYVHLLLVSVTVICTLLLFLFFRGYSSGMVVELFDRLSRLPWIGEKIGSWRERNNGTFAAIDKGVSSLMAEHKLAFVSSLALELLARLVCCVELMFLGQAIGVGLDFAQCLLVYAFSSLLANLLFFSPLQMGTREGGIAWALLLIGIGGDVEALLPLAVAISMGTRIREFVWIAIGGCLSATGREK